MSRDYEPREGYCVKGVWGESGWRRHQCNFKVKVVRDGKGYCTIHDPVRVAEKQQERNEKYNADSRRERRERCLGWLGPRCLKALVKVDAQRTKATVSGEYEGCEEIRELIRIAKQEGFEI